MLKNDPDFTRLKKLGGRTSMGSASYWLGRDHLMVVEVSNYNESYRRFYFRDVQAVIVQRNSLRMWGNILAAALGSVVFIPIVVAFGTPEAWPILVFFTILLLSSMMGIFFNTVRGPMCSVQIRTAVQTQKLMGITRQRRAELLLETIEPLIQQAQSSGTGTSLADSEPGSGDLDSPISRPETS